MEKTHHQIVTEAFDAVGIKYIVRTDIAIENAGMGKQVSYSPGQTLVTIDHGGNNEADRFSHLAFGLDGRYKHKETKQSI